MGFVVPSVRLWDNLQLDSQEYQILFRGNMVGRGTLRPGRWLAMNISHSDQVIPGEATTEPVFNLPAVWIDELHRSSAELAGYTVVDSTSVLVTHFQECIRRHAHQLLSRQDVDGLLDNLKKTQSALVNELVPAQLNLGQIQRILQNLLIEGISIRNLVSILERVADSAAITKNIDELSEQARRSIGPELVKGYLDDRGNLAAITLESWLEEELAKGLHPGMTENTLALTVRRSSQQWLRDAFRCCCVLESSASDSGSSSVPPIPTCAFWPTRNCLHDSGSTPSTRSPVCLDASA
jgi:flagellar biosynthesis protein FlhA